MKKKHSKTNRNDSGDGQLNDDAHYCVRMHAASRRGLSALPAQGEEEEES